MNDQLISKTVSRRINIPAARKLSSNSFEKASPYQRTVQCGFLLALAFFALASSAAAQPAMSRGEQLLPINYNECSRRAEQAYIAEGWVNIGKGGAFVRAFKENNGAYITCNVAPENKIWANIFVASNSGDSNVPGAERVKLQNRMGMEQSVSGGCGLGTRWDESEEGWRATWTRRGNSNVFDVQSRKGDMSLTAVHTINISGNRVSVSRTYASDGNNCEMQGTINPDGVTVNGTYSCRSGGPYSWSAKINCQ
jgi:hypothetical protein